MQLATDNSDTAVATVVVLNDLNWSALVSFEKLWSDRSNTAVWWDRV